MVNAPGVALTISCGDKRLSVRNTVGAGAGIVTPIGSAAALIAPSGSGGACGPGTTGRAASAAGTTAGAAVVEAAERSGPVSCAATAWQHMYNARHARLVRFRTLIMDGRQKKPALREPGVRSTIDDSLISRRR